MKKQVEDNKYGEKEKSLVEKDKDLLVFMQHDEFWDQAEKVNNISFENSL